MADGRITKRTVDSLKAAKSDYVRWDGDLKGFGVRVRPSGAKSFVAVYRTGGRNTPLRKITIGTFGKLTVEQARVAAARILAKAELGEDEAAAKSESRTARTVAQLCEIYLAEGCDKKKPSTIAVDRGRIARHIVPLLGRKLVTTISSAEIEQFMHDVAKGKTAADVKTVKFGRAVVRGGKARRHGLFDSWVGFSVSRSGANCERTTPFAGSKSIRIARANVSCRPTNLSASVRQSARRKQLASMGS